MTQLPPLKPYLERISVLLYLKSSLFRCAFGILVRHWSPLLFCLVMVLHASANNGADGDCVQLNRATKASTTLAQS